MSQFAIFSVPIAAFLAYVPHFAKVAVLRGRSQYDNAKPRDVPADDELITRLGNAHVNQLEMLGVYAAGVAVATAANTPSTIILALSISYVIARFLFVIAYASPQVAGGLLRSFTFMLSMGSNLALWILAAINFTR